MRYCRLRAGASRKLTKQERVVGHGLGVGVPGHLWCPMQAHLSPYSLAERRYQDLGGTRLA